MCEFSIEFVAMLSVESVNKFICQPFANHSYHLLHFCMFVWKYDRARLKCVRTPRYLASYFS